MLENSRHCLPVGESPRAPPFPSAYVMVLLFLLLTLTPRDPELGLPAWPCSVVSLTLIRTSDSITLLCLVPSSLFVMSTQSQVLIWFYNQTCIQCILRLGLYPGDISPALSLLPNNERFQPTQILSKFLVFSVICYYIPAEYIH